MNVQNRELQIMKLVDHLNIVRLKHCFFSTTEKDETYLHLVRIIWAWTLELHAFCTTSCAVQYLVMSCSQHA